MNLLKTSTFHNYKIYSTDNERAVEIVMQVGRFEERVQLHWMNRGQSDAKFEVALPWNGGFNVAVKWQFGFPARSAGKLTIGKALDATSSCGQFKGSYRDSFIDALFNAVTMLKRISH